MKIVEYLQLREIHNDEKYTTIMAVYFLCKENKRM